MKPNQIKAARIVTKKGVRINGRHYFSTDLPELIGQLVYVDLPEGPLPEKLTARFEARVLTIRSFGPELLRSHYERIFRHRPHCEAPSVNIDEPNHNEHPG
ncbi:MAG: hypothetical protein A4E74_02542 [Syntrophus sp. PtaB.Bin075]|nr:MAG: hypothetical protein A4E74_02542 [Syntrophus sp. PtaB.Bin075]